MEYSGAGEQSRETQRCGLTRSLCHGHTVPHGAASAHPVRSKRSVVDAEARHGVTLRAVNDLDFGEHLGGRRGR
jgi:hypothetical protein